MGYEFGNKLPFGVEFLYALESSGRLGCIVDITDSGKGFANTCEDLCSYLANILELKRRVIISARIFIFLS